MASKQNLEKASVIRAKLEQDVATVNSLLGVDTAEARKQIAELTGTFKDRASDLNAAMQAEEFAILRDAEDPMMAAILKLMIPSASVAFRKDKETEVEAWGIFDSAKVINLVAFENFCSKKTIAHTVGWRYKAENVARLLSAHVTEEIGTAAQVEALLKNFKMSKTAKAAHGTQTAKPTSMTTLTKLLQELVDMILFKATEDGKGLNQYKVTSKDASFMLFLACKEAKKPKTATMPTASTVIKLTVQIINQIVTKSGYESAYKEND